MGGLRAAVAPGFNGPSVAGPFHQEMQLRINAYVHPYRMNQKTTGVGKHMINMVAQLNRIPDNQVSLLASAEQMDSDGKIQSDLPVRNLPTTALPGTLRGLEMKWALFNHPDVSRYCKGADWIYCPTEVYIPARSIPLAVTIHCVNWFERDLPWSQAWPTRVKRMRMELKWRPMLQESRILFTVSNFLKSRIIELFKVPEKKIVVVGNGVEQEYFDAGRSTAPIAKRDRPYVLIVGGLTARKGAPHVLEVARRLQKTDPDIELIIAGTSEPEYERQARELKNVISIGHETAATISSLMRGSIALMFLSRYETFGIPAVEAMAAGTPAIVSHWAALPEIVGDVGLIVHADKPAEVIEIIQQLRRDDALRAAQVQKGLAHVQQFTWDQCAKRVHDGLRQCNDEMQ
jgi:glycosyltransferase involved in cell wall biosynthesis